MSHPLPLTLLRTLAGIDLETTGVDVNEDRIVQIAVVLLSPDGTRTRRSRIINPGRPIPKEASEIHGISDDDVTGKPLFWQVAKSLQTLLTGVDITGYNVRRFDVPLLAAEFKRCDIVWPNPHQLVVDSFEIFKRQEPHKLAQALEFYTGDILGDDAHDAVADAEAAMNVLLGQAERYGVDDPVPGAKVLLAALINLSRDPDWLDVEGKVKWEGDTAVINFGKWQGKPLQQVDTGYFTWVLKQDFEEDFNAICRAAAAGEYPARGSL